MKLWDDVDRYIAETLVQPDQALQAALDASDAAGLPAISVSASHGKLLWTFARLLNARRILDACRIPRLVGQRLELRWFVEHGARLTRTAARMTALPGFVRQRQRTSRRSHAERESLGTPGAGRRRALVSACDPNRVHCPKACSA